MSRNLPSTPDTPPPGPIPYGGGAPGYADYAPDTTPQSGFDWRRYGSALGRYKWVLLGAAVLGMGVGALLYRRAIPLYTARATMTIQPMTMQETQRGPISSPQHITADAWVDLLETGMVLEPVVREWRLHISPYQRGDRDVLASLELADDYRRGAYRLTVGPEGRTFELSLINGPVLQRGAVGEPIGAEVGMIWQPDASQLTPGRLIEFDLFTVPEAVQGLANALRPTLSESQTLLTISASQASPSGAASLVNAVAQRFEVVAGEYKAKRLIELTDILREQLDSANYKLAEAENRLSAFQSRNIAAAMPLGGNEAAVERFTMMRLDASRLSDARRLIQQVIADGEINDGEAIALEGLEEVRSASEITSALADLTGSKAELRVLRQEFTDEHLQVKRKQAQIDSLEAITLPRLAGSLMTDLQRRESELRSTIEETGGQLQQVPARTMTLLELTRARDVAFNLWQDLRQKFDAATVAALSITPDLRVADLAVPPGRPSTDTRPALFLIASLGTVGLALLGIAVRDRADRRVRYPDQVTTELGLPILGAAPHVRRRNGSLRLAEAAAVVEAFRGIRLNVHYAHGVDGPMSIAITSPAAGDGKSFVTSNLALAFAEQGYRTVIVDADVRRGTLHRLMEAGRKPGLTDFLAGRAAREDVIQPTKYPYLSVISCGTRMDSGPALLSSEKMRSLIQTLRTDFAVVLFDTAPLSAGADPLVLATAMGNLVLVLRTGSTDRHLAEAKLGVIDRLPIRLLGAVLNDVPPGGVYDYYYRAYSYLPDYAGEIEDAETVDGETVAALPRPQDG